MDMENTGAVADINHPEAVPENGNKKVSYPIATASVSFLVMAIVLTTLFFLQSVRKDYSADASEAAQLNNSGDYARAQKLLLAKTETDSAPELQLMLANSYLDEGSVRGKEAEASKKALSILLGLENTYRNTYLYDLLGYSYEIVNDFDKALDYYNKSLALDESSVNTLFSIGHTYWLKGETDKARDFYNQAERAITEQGENAVKVKVYAGIAVLSKDLAVAEQYFLKAVPLSDSRAFKAEMYSDLATLKLVQQDNKKAFEYAQLALATDPSSEMAHLVFAKSAMADKNTLEANFEKVRLSLFKAIFLAPTKAETQYWQGKFEFIGGKYDQAIRSYGNALKLLPDDNSLNTDSRTALKSDINFNIAVVYYLKNDEKNANIFIKEAFRDNPVKVMYVLERSEQLKELLRMITT